MIRAHILFWCLSIRNLRLHSLVSTWPDRLSLEFVPAIPTHKFQAWSSNCKKLSSTGEPALVTFGPASEEDRHDFGQLIKFLGESGSVRRWRSQ